MSDTPIIQTFAFKDEQIEAVNLDRQSKGLSVRSLDRTELGRLASATSGEVNGATLQLPTTGYHTAKETVLMESVRSAIRLGDKLIELTK